MSYRAFKRLLGETSLERKCRWLLGAGVLVLMTGSFWVYAKQTEDLAYGQLETTGRALLTPILARLHVKEGEDRDSLDEFQKLTDANWPATLKGYNYNLRKPDTKDPQNQPTSDDLATMYRIQNDTSKNEETRQAPKETAFYYYGAIRASQSCINCHSNPAKVGEKLARPDLKQGEVMAVVRIRLPTESIDEGFHTNRAVLISFALGTSLLIIAGSYLIIRYVIVKPVKHLK